MAEGSRDVVAQVVALLNGLHVLCGECQGDLDRDDFRVIDGRLRCVRDVACRWRASIVRPGARGRA